jgi:hypothetical protein
MKRLLFFWFVCNCLLLGCGNESPEVTEIELRSDLDEEEFKQAIAGEWQSVYEIAGEENVTYLHLGQENQVSLTLRKNGAAKEFSGVYTLSFIRTPVPGTVTMAEMDIQTSDTLIVLSRINFGLHNAFPMSEGLFLRIDEAPYGVLDRIE